MKKIIGGLALVMLMTFSSGLNVQTKTSVGEEMKVLKKENEKVTLLQSNNEDYVRYLGRTRYDANSQITWFNYSASGLEINFYGTEVSALVYGTSTDSINARPYISVMLDDENNPDYALVIKLTKPEEKIKLAEGLKLGHHKLKIYKRSECEVSHAGIKEFETDGYFEKKDEVKDDKLKIEIFGDSLTCGYQVEGLVFDEDFTTRLENALKSYGFYCANELGAELSLVSAGGFPVYKSEYTGAWKVKDIPSMFDMTDFDFGTTLTSYTKWDNSKYVPDVVVINLGANDGSSFSKCTTEEERTSFLDNFETTYRNFVSKINETYGNKTKIISCTNMIGLDNSIKERIIKIINDNENITRWESNCISVGGVMPGRGHPNVEMQKYAGHELAELISNLMK